MTFRLDQGLLQLNRQLTSVKILNMFKQIALSALTHSAMPLVSANGVFQSVAGDVRSGAADVSFVATRVDSRIAEGTTATTEFNSCTVIRLNDGHTVVSAKNTEFVLTAYKFERVTTVKNNSVVQLLIGALRSFSGLSRGKNPASSP